MLAPENAAFRTPPITVELRARLHSKNNFNILAACDTKASGAHWEIFTFAGDGQLAVYTPGLKPDHVKTGKDICDGNWHQVTMQYEPTRMRAPRVVAKGVDLIALNIRRIAEQHRVPVFESPKLARALYRSTDLNEEIPSGLYLAVAQVLSYIFRIRSLDPTQAARLSRPVPEVGAEFDVS